MKKIFILLSFVLSFVLKSAESLSIMQKYDLQSTPLMPVSSRFILSMYNHESVKLVPDIAQADFWKDPIIQKFVGSFGIGANDIFFVLRDALQAHKVCGFVRFNILSNRIHIHQLAIDKNYRGCGLATVLLEEIEKLALTKNIFLQLAVYDDNIAAVKFYKNNNFEFV